MQNSCFFLIHKKYSANQINFHNVLVLKILKKLYSTEAKLELHLMLVKASNSVCPMFNSNQII